ncbi:G-type lectin S-receptor-like serine/threonine-protein kinase At2g19130 [Pyrus x bretschneideri]|uniref:G-type lectin S-receptor-like serine/threonine-protein kinase At2g19130 n=1 Tax=Pyrus x bretschneideri TaxID=225117 RepID=UPI002030D074|nr:G-type lectin S-receptor-like serine/threonine-protein kinase At2g19130 [Pyrus x bretschneideri]
MEIISNNNLISQSVVLLLLCFTFNGTSMASDTIYAGRTLSGTQTITSAGGIFELGFFTAGNSRNYYVGIWYKTLRPRTVVWVANRNQPASGSSPLTLQLFRNGSLALLEQTKSTIWSTQSMSAVSDSTMAVLLDNGNLVIRDELDSSAVLWQSFDHPTDTWLPGAKLGYNKLTKEKLVLTPSRNPQNPAPGIFSLEMELTGTISATLRICLVVDAWTDLNPKSQKIGILEVKSIEECILACSRDCSITAFLYDNDCKIWKGDIFNLIQLPSSLTKLIDYRKMHLRVADSTNEVKRKITWIAVGVLAGFLSISTILMVFLIRKRSKGASPIVQDSLVLFKYKDLRRATDNFSEKLGEGGFGSVFKGILPNSTDIAVKKLKYLEQGEKQFRAEVGTIGAIHHINVVRLWGFCTETSKRLLVYEYMPNGSLQSLFHQENALMLDWDARYHIAVGTARGLAYLHEECRDCIIHCDIKPDNILLDAEYSPKLADFGLAKLVGRHHSRVLTTMRGTVGYLAPEWFSGEAITPKADVFSYGMLLIEVITGRRNREGLDEGLENYRPLMVANVVNKGEDVGTLLDYRLEGRADKDELAQACKVACWCIQEDEKDRPTMRQVVQILEGVSDVNIPPIPQFLQRLVQCPLEGVNHLKTTCSSGLWSCSDDQSAFQAKINNRETNIHEDAPEGEHCTSLCTR